MNSIVYFTRRIIDIFNGNNTNTYKKQYMNGYINDNDTNINTKKRKPSATESDDYADSVESGIYEIDNYDTDDIYFYEVVNYTWKPYD